MFLRMIIQPIITDIQITINKMKVNKNTKQRNETKIQKISIFKPYSFFHSCPTHQTMNLHHFDSNFVAVMI